MTPSIKVSRDVVMADQLGCFWFLKITFKSTGL